MKKSKDGLVIFDEASHTYKLKGNILTSVTQYVSKFKQPFDMDNIAQKYADKHHTLKNLVIKKWKEQGEQACEIGTYIHSIFEDYILNKTHKYKDVNKTDTAKLIIETLFESGRLTPVETEYIVYNEKYAGQVDCIAKNKKGDYFILDWKTNKEIKEHNPWSSMLGEFSYLTDCSFNHYSIQLNAYRELCSEYKIKGMYIVHLMDRRYKIIKCKDLTVNLD